GDHAATPPDLGDVPKIEVVLVVFWIAQGRGLRVNLVLSLPDICGTQHGQSFGVGSHNPVLNSVVDHLDEMAAAVRAAVQVALFCGAIDPFAARRPGYVADARRER